MPERDFWRMTPKKLSVLMAKYMESCGYGEKALQEENEKAFNQLMQL